MSLRQMPVNVEEALNVRNIGTEKLEIELENLKHFVHYLSCITGPFTQSTVWEGVRPPKWEDQSSLINKIKALEETWKALMNVHSSLQWNVDGAEPGEIVGYPEITPEMMDNWLFDMGDKVEDRICMAEWCPVPKKTS